MAFSPSFTCKNKPNTYHKSLTSLTYVSSLARRRIQHTPRVKVVIPNPIFGTTNNVRKCITHQKKPEMKCKFTENSDFSNFDINPASVSDVIEIFRVCVNNKNNTKRLKGLISNDCCIEEPLKLPGIPEKTIGKERCIWLLTKLADVISSKNLQFKQKYICEGEELTAFVEWILEDAATQIPKYSGCSKVQCSKEDDRLVIRDIHQLTVLIFIEIEDWKTKQEPSSSLEQS